jgi:hypothetical protein
MEIIEQRSGEEKDMRVFGNLKVRKADFCIVNITNG